MSDGNTPIKFGLALLLPFLAWALQSLLWDVVQPFYWFFFYPAVFASSWLGGRAAGLIATAISMLLANYFFMEPAHTLWAGDVHQLLTLLMFGAMGVVFSLAQGHAKDAFAQRHLEDSRFRTVFEDAPLGIALIDSHTGHIYEVNRRFAAIAGRTPEEMSSIDWMAITHPDDVQEDLDNMARLNAGEIPGFQMNKRYLKPDGTVVWINMTIAPVSVAPGESPRHLCMIEDITERRTTEERQARVRERQQLANDVADIGIWDWDLHTNQLQWDGRLCRWYGVTPEQQQAGLVYERWRDAVHPDDLAATEAGLQEAIHTNGVWDAIFRIRRADGAERTIHGAGIVHYDDQHRPLRMLGINQDITAQQAQLAALTEAKAELARVASETRLSAVIEQGLVGVGEIDTEGRFLRVNDRYAGLLGYTREQLEGKTVRDITDPRDWAESQAYLQNLLEHGRPFTLEKRYIRQDGQPFWGKVVAMPVVNPTTRATTVLALIVDIDAAKQAEERLRLALASSQIGMYDWDIARGTITWSAEHERLWGYRPGEFDGSFDGFARRVHPDDLKVTQARLDGARSSGEPYRHEFRVIWPDGSTHWIAGRGEFEYDVAGHAVRMRGTVLDITERMRAEIDLREQKQRLEESQRIAKIGSWVHELDGRLGPCSTEAYKSMGIEAETLTPHEDMLMALMHPEDQPLMQAWFEQCRAGQRPGPLIVRRYWPDGSLHYLRGQGELQHDHQGRPLRIVGTVQDVTEMHLATEQLRDSQQQLTLSLEAGQFGAWHWELAGTRLQVTPIFRHIFGLPDAPDYEYDLLIDRIHPDDRPRVEADLQQVMATDGRYSHEYRLRMPDGAERWIAAYGQVTVSENGRSRRLHGIIQDITARKQATQDLERLRLLMAEGERIAHIGTWEYVVATQETVWSEEECRIYGYDPAGPSPDYATLLRDSIHPEDAERLDHCFQAALQAGAPFELEHRVVRPDGTVRVVENLAHPVFDDAGQVVKYIGTTLDITERSTMEKEILALNADLEQKIEQRTAQLAIANAAKSQFLASMSHEIRTPMNGVLGLAQLLEQEPLTENQQYMVRMINDSGKTLLGIINDILDFSKIEAGQLQIEKHPFHLKDTLESVTSLLGVTSQKKGLGLRQELPPNLTGRLRGDALRIEQILLNLGSNAVKFTEQGEVVIRVVPLAMTDQSVRLRFEVQDTGIGLSPEAIEKLFQPFTQADGSITRRFGGTGLGLSISKRLVELMGGTIGVDSTLGQGSTFWFELPFERVAEAAVTESTAAQPAGPALQGLRLLVVDDSDINLLVADRALKRLGADVTTAKNGQLALDCLTAHPDGFDLVLMDIQMPVMDGLAATRAIREELHLQTLPVIALTAGVLAEEKQAALDAGVNDFLPKPMDLELMASMIRSYCPVRG